MVKPPDHAPTGRRGLVRFLSNTQISVLACARRTSFHASKRQRSRPSAESQPPPDLTQQSGIYRASSPAQHSNPPNSVKHIPNKMLTERTASPAPGSPNGSRRRGGH